MTNKTIFLFLLSLMIYGTVSVNAQVRIGGNSVPHPSSVLDLNPDNTDAATASGGLLLPHVRLDSVKHTAVFGNGITPAEGLMVYNVDDGKTGRPEKGVYCYMGGEWVPVGAEVAAATSDPDDPGDPDLMYTGPRFSISGDLAEKKGLWLGRNGEFKKAVNISIPSEVKDYGYPIQYIWFITDTVTQQVTSITTSDDSLQIPATLQNEIKSGKVYRLFLSVHIYDFETDTVPVGHIAYGIGAWTGRNRWLTVANANVGANQDLTLENQLTENHIERPLKRIMGDYFQWGRLPDGHEIYADKLNPDDTENPNIFSGSSITYPSPVPASDLDSYGQPKIGSGSYAKFITVKNSDWREYPDSMTVSGSIAASNEARKPWYWRTQEEPAIGVDPCSPAMDGYPGEWFVMTPSQWESITEHNRIAELNTDLARGVAIYPNGDSDISFYLPGAAYRSGEHGYLDSRYEWGDSSFYGWDSSRKKDRYLWLNSPHEGDIDSAYLLKWTGTGSSGEIGWRADGLPIRCVSY